MGVITKFELYKIMKRKSSKIAIIMVLVTIVLIVFMMISQENTTTDTGKEVNGISAISLKKTFNHKNPELLTTEKIASVIEEYNNVMSDKNNLVAATDGSGMVISDEAFGKFFEKEQIAQDLIRSAYSEKGYDYYIFKTLTKDDASHFYDNRLKRVTDYLNTDYTYGNYSEKDKLLFMGLNENIKLPLTIGYDSGWSKILAYLSIIILAIAIAICVCISPVFASEYQTGAVSIILSSRFGKSKVITSKFISSLIYTTLLYFGGLVIYALLVLSIYGFSGWNNSLQSIVLISPYPLTLLQTVLLSSFIGYLICIMMMSLTLFFSAKMKSPFSVIILSSLIIFTPLFIPYSKSSRTLNNLINLLPAKAINSYDILCHYEIYHIFGIEIVAPVMIGIFALFVTAIAVPLAYYGFKRHQVE